MPGRNSRMSVNASEADKALIERKAAMFNRAASLDLQLLGTGSSVPNVPSERAIVALYDARDALLKGADPEGEGPGAGREQLAEAIDSLALELVRLRGRTVRPARPTKRAIAREAGRSRPSSRWKRHGE